TWFQAQQACLNVGKRLPTNAEWQGAAAGTPDPGTDNEMTDCNIGGPPFDVTATGSRSNCVSNFGAFDMVGNLFEWVADWIQDNGDNDRGDVSTALYGMDLIFGIDEAFPEADRFPAALFRGGGFDFGASAGVFALVADVAPSVSGLSIGFRCARNR
ncbi:MAG: SUMF1/EgtB/PvdO family nonheme iron enzyme, partial [Candidatus Dadabacteria bacterium]|nr:SUMF1/EgtB/PvdO family nonheme iron enzyme [Candidatus Dadabacteria bacterium]